jgi:hypothetical protein
MFTDSHIFYVAFDKFDEIRLGLKRKLVDAATMRLSSAGACGHGVKYRLDSEEDGVSC